MYQVLKSLFDEIPILRIHEMTEVDCEDIGENDRNPKLICGRVVRNICQGKLCPTDAASFRPRVQGHQDQNTPETGEHAHSVHQIGVLNTKN
jgi:hypothetical protein